MFGFFHRSFRIEVDLRRCQILCILVNAVFLDRALTLDRDRWMLLASIQAAWNFHKNTALGCLVWELDEDLLAVEVLVRILV